MVDEIKLEFLLAHWPQIQSQALGQEGWPIRYTFIHPHAEPSGTDAECVIEITEEEYSTTGEAWCYYIGE